MLVLVLVLVRVLVLLLRVLALLLRVLVLLVLLLRLLLLGPGYLGLLCVVLAPRLGVLLLLPVRRVVPPARTRGVGTEQTNGKHTLNTHTASTR